MNKKTISDIQQKIKDADDPDNFITLPKTLKWKNNNGRFITGTYTSHDATGFTINGKKHVNKFSDYSPGIKAYCESLSPQPSESDDHPQATNGSNSKTYEIEDWMNSKGKIVQAKFVSLIDGNITLENEKGKTFSFALKQLSKESQMRALQLAE